MKQYQNIFSIILPNTRLLLTTTPFFFEIILPIFNLQFDRLETKNARSKVVQFETC